MSREAKSANVGGTYYIKRGDEVASIIINPLTGTDRGDVQVPNSYLAD